MPESESDVLRRVLIEWVTNADLRLLRRLAALRSSISAGSLELDLPPGWLSLAAVAAKTNRNMGNLRRVAASRYASRGHARIARSATTGQTTWFFSPEAVAEMQ